MTLIEAILAELRRLREENARLWAELERLRKAGDSPKKDLG